jgi:hypothetical protein
VHCHRRSFWKKDCELLTHICVHTRAALLLQMLHHWMLAHSPTSSTNPPTKTLEVVLPDSFHQLLLESPAAAPLICRTTQGLESSSDQGAQEHWIFKSPQIEHENIFWIVAFEKNVMLHELAVWPPPGLHVLQFRNFKARLVELQLLFSKSSIRLPEWPLLLVTHSSSMHTNSHTNGEPHAWTSSSPGSN